MTTLNTIIEEENTPDTEWEKDFDEKFGWLKRSKVTGAQLYDQMMLKHFITSLLSSRDTYLKERVEKVKGLLEGIGSGAFSRDPLQHAENVIEEALRIKEEALDTLLDNWK